MARRKNIQFLEEHRQLVASGRSTMAELADTLGIARQTAFDAFRKRGWATVAKAEDKAPSLPAAVPPSSAAVPAPAKGSQRRYRRQRPVAGSVPPPSASAASSPPSASGTPSLPIPTVASAEHLIDLTRLELSNAALLAIAIARDMMATGNVGPAGLKSLVAAMGGAADLLARCGSDLDASVSNGVSMLTVTEMTAADVERTQAEVEAAFHHEEMGSSDGAPGDDDEPVEDM